MRFHVVGLPHTQTTKDYSACAYTEKVRKFCNMMSSLGHEVILYASEDNEAEVSELVTCITKKEQVKHGFSGPEDYQNIFFSNDLPIWGDFNPKVVKQIKKRIQPRDFICLISGIASKPVADEFPEHMSVEFGIGYGGTFSKYRVFESYAWMHMVYAQGHQNVHTVDGQFFDTVIPNYFEAEDFPFEKKKDDYYLYVGRLVERKGYKIAQEVCQKLGKRLILAGPGQFTGYGEHVGTVGPELRGDLMSKAQGLFAPTLYIEPFGGVAVEAQMCGTPVISTDWGAFTETVLPGFTGFRCRTFQEFLDAANDVASFSNEQRKMIRKRAQEAYSTDSVKYKYQTYFERLLTLWDDGWYNIK